MLKAIAFDAFGTLVDIFDKRGPYQSVAKAAHAVPLISPMTTRTSLEEYARQCQTPWNKAWADDLAAELASIAPYPETIDVLSAVRARGLKTVVASNLALPYGAPVIDQLGTWLDVACFSFEMGAVKPQPAFYQALCEQLNCEPSEVLMVGDTWRSDYAGATAVGMPALHLNRRGKVRPEREAMSIQDLRGVLAFLATA